MYNLVTIQGIEVRNYESLTFQHMLLRFRSIDTDSRLIAVGAENSTGPIGLVLVDVNPERGTAEILSLFVKNDFRRLGIGSALLSKIEEQILIAGCKTMKFTYYSGKKITPALEAFLNKQGWSIPTVQTLIYTTHIESMTKVAWFRKANFPKQMQSFLWSELTGIQRESLKDSKVMGYPAYLSPFRNEHKIEKLISLGLRANDQVIGWSIVHRVSEDTLLYNSLFVQSQYQHLGCAINLLAATIHLQQELNIPYSMFAVNLNNPNMIRIVDRWFKPFTIKTTEMYATFKSTS